MTKHALIIIDLQNDYFPEGKWPLHKIETAAGNAAKILERVRKTDDLIIHVHHEFLNDEPPFFAPNTPGSAIHESMKPLANEPSVLKHQVNAFNETQLKDILDEHNISDVTIIGAMGHMCIDAASRAASDFGYKVTVVEDACASTELELNGKVVAAEDVHTAYMSALGFAYADIKSTEEYLAA